MNKEELRSLYRQIRLRMSKGEVSSKSRMIGSRLLNEISWQKHKKICTYQPIITLNEVNTNPLTSRLKAQGLNVKIIAAAKGQTIPAGNYDVILVPCLAFDGRRYRLGWGGGWYDSFLRTQPQARKIGLAFQNGFAEAGLPDDEHDIPLDMIITESKIY